MLYKDAHHFRLTATSGSVVSCLMQVSQELRFHHPPALFIKAKKAFAPNGWQWITRRGERDQNAERQIRGNQVGGRDQSSL